MRRCLPHTLCLRSLCFSVIPILLVCALPIYALAQTDDIFIREVGCIENDTIFLELPRDLNSTSQDLPIRLVVLGKVDTTFITTCRRDSIAFRFLLNSQAYHIDLKPDPVDTLRLIASVEIGNREPRILLLKADTVSMDALAGAFSQIVLDRIRARDFDWIESHTSFPQDMVLHSHVVKIRNRAAFRRFRKQIFSDSFYTAVQDSSNITFGQRNGSYFLNFWARDRDGLYISTAIWFNPNEVLGRIRWQIMFYDIAK
jgi:hypothetical protein